MGLGKMMKCIYIRSVPHMSSLGLTQYLCLSIQLCKLLFLGFQHFFKILMLLQQMFNIRDRILGNEVNKYNYLIQKGHWREKKRKEQSKERETSKLVVRNGYEAFQVMKHR